MRPYLTWWDIIVAGFKAILIFMAICLVGVLLGGEK